MTELRLRFQSRFRCELLTGEHDLLKFDCGTEQLNTWLRNSGMRGQVQGTGRTFVLVEQNEDDKVVVGYFTLAAHMIHRDDLADAIARGRLRSLPNQLPAILLARLALDHRLKGQGYGGGLLAAALERCVRAGRLAAAVYVVVDAIDDDALEFYAKRDFLLVPGTYRLVRPMRSIADEMEIPEPEDL